MRISVRGYDQVEVPPDFARLHGEAAAQGPDKALVLRRVTDAARGLTDALAALHDAGRVTRWAVRPMTVSSFQAYGSTGTLEHHASMSWWADVPQTDDLAELVAVQAAADAMVLGRTEWLLRDETRARHEAECLARAVTGARDRAVAIATAAGAGEVRFVEVADPGLTGRLGGPVQMMAQSAMSEAARVEVRPEDITIGVELHAVFEA